MSSKQPLECFVCKNNGFPAVMVYLAGKDEQGRTIRQEADGSPHIHNSKAPSQQQSQQQQNGRSTVVSESTQLKIIQAKLDRVIGILEERLSPKDDESYSRRKETSLDILVGSTRSGVE